MRSIAPIAETLLSAYHVYIYKRKVVYQTSINVWCSNLTKIVKFSVYTVTFHKSHKKNGTVKVSFFYIPPPADLSVSITAVATVGRVS